MGNNADILFAEEQKFRQGWLWLLLTGTVLVGLVGAVSVLVFLPYKTEVAQMIMWLIMGFILFISVLIPLGVCALFYFMKLAIEVRLDGIYLRFSPFHRSYRCIHFDQIERYYMRQYRPVAEFGGWGIRRGWGDAGKAYNVRGNEGIQLVLRDGAKLLIGSQRSSEFSSALDRALEQNQRSGAVE